jgi:hypothetical protein
MAGNKLMNLIIRFNLEYPEKAKTATMQEFKLWLADRRAMRLI